MLIDNNVKDRNMPIKVKAILHPPCDTIQRCSLNYTLLSNIIKCMSNVLKYRLENMRIYAYSLI